MARDAFGNYTLPASYEVHVGDTLEVDQHNAPFEDLETEMQDSLCRSGKGAMLANLDMGSKAIVDCDYLAFNDDGDIDNPFIRFNDADTGLFRDGTDIKLSIDGTLRAVFEDSDTTASNAETIMTREKGDARYPVLDGGGLVEVADLPAATTTAKGVVEKATNAEMIAGTADKFPDCATIVANIWGPDVEVKRDPTNFTYSGTAWAVGSDTIEKTPSAGAAGLEVMWAGDIYVLDNSDGAISHLVRFQYKNAAGAWQYVTLGVPTNTMRTYATPDAGDFDALGMRTTCSYWFWLTDGMVNPAGKWEMRAVFNCGGIGYTVYIYDQVWRMQELAGFTYTTI